MSVFDLADFGARLATEDRERSWRPLLAKLAPGESAAFGELCRTHGIRMSNAIGRQLVDLARVRLPGAEEGERRRYVEERIGAAGDEAAVGTWVCLPWRRIVAHLLDEGDYFDVITDRNRDKITAAEQRELRTKRIGVVGLSVGAEAAVVVAQEHLCGGIVLADFDELELSNLNRIGAELTDLGENKAVLAARRIAAIDPYLDVRILEEGVNESNVDAFLEGLDLLLEECDDLALKHAIRVRARARRLNIVFAGDERGFLSIEPHAHEPDLEPFHGRVRAAPPPRESFPTPAAFMRSLAEWLGGWDALSERSRDSLVRIGETRNGYPQLAGEARFAAGQVAHVVRRLLLGERLPSWIGHVDLEDLLPGDRREPARTAGPT